MFYFLGSILVAKAWRISCLLSPVAAFASTSPSNLTAKNNNPTAIRIKVINGLTKLSVRTRIITTCGCTGRNKSVHRRSSGLRVQVTLADLLHVAVCLVMPQIILQIINLSVPSIRMRSIDIEDGIKICQSDIGYWFLAPGIILAVIPFILALILNMKSRSQSMPNVLREYNQILNAMKIAIGVLSITLPTISMVGQTLSNAYAYLMSASLLSFILPICYNIGWVKIWMIRKSNKTNQKSKAVNRLGSDLSTTASSSSSTDNADGDSLEKLVAAEDAIVMGNMYSNMGNIKKALEVDADILSMFKQDGNEYDESEGFTTHEIRKMGPKTLEAVTAQLICNAKHWNTSMHGVQGRDEKDNRIKKSTKSCLDALRIFQQAPAKLQLKDRSVVFPGYSYLAVLLKSGDVDAPTDQSSAEFEQDIASKFVNETQFALFHHCRSLAMKAEFLANDQSFESAIDIVEQIKLIYDPAIHSKTIAEEYSLDHAGNIISMSALWLYHLNRQEDALVVCDKVIDTILPEYCEKDFLNLTLLLLPIIKVLIMAQGCDGAKRSRELYDKHVYKPGGNTKGFATPVMRPLMILLSCCIHASDYDNDSKGVNYDGIDDDIDWVLNGEDKINEFGDTVMTKTISWSPTNITAEACLYLSKSLGSGEEKQRALLEEGIRLCKVATAKMKDSEGSVTLPIAYAYHEKIFSELKSLSVPV